MRNYTKKFKAEWEFFINPKTGYVTYHKFCNECQEACKQSFRVKIVACPNHKKNEGKNVNDRGGRKKRKL